ncbi:unnamed protein product [Moneuplotes crassus]|uniref:Uncharacterized protein n=1 Tax=Euplotes crassus TaxID=5936 RepID=A0AAD1XAJ7_EUPCR|nr:unnamed protein product [Moneuplotes crassus]
MQKIHNLSRTYSQEVKDIWDDSDMEISEETCECIPHKSLHHTKQFNNTLKNNKGKIKLEDLSDFVGVNEGFKQQPLATYPPVRLVDGEFGMSNDKKEMNKDISNPTKLKRSFKRASSELHKGAKILSDLRGVPSFELLKKIH